MLKLEPAIQTMIDATNQADSARLLSAFSDDSVLVDEGRIFKGKAEIARWNENENIGTHNQLHVTRVKRSGKAVSVDITVTGDDYNGSGTLTFQLDGETIKRLVITG
jgi:ketosteroid isomerase-like protein